MVKHLPHFVLVRLEPMANRSHRRFAAGFGVNVAPAVLFLDWRAEKMLGWIGDVSEEEVAAKLREMRDAADQDPPD